MTGIPVMIAERFRCQFLLQSGLDYIFVVPVIPTGAAGRYPESHSGTVCGRAELLTFISDIGLDSIVTRRQLSDLPDLAFELTFHVTSPERIVAMVEGRVNGRRDAVGRILEGEPFSEELHRALAPFESFTLGASQLEPSEGVRRVSAWLTRRSDRGDR